jgi:hypothetical protein
MLETTTLSDEAILRGLNANPQFKHRVPPVSLQELGHDVG